MLSRILLIVAACGLLFAQPNELNLRQDPPAAVQSNQVNAVYTGTAGGTTYYYWVVTRYPIGFSVPVSPVVVARAASSLGGGNSVALTWPAMAGASSYDVLRTSTPAAPSSCTCAVTLATTSTTLTDNGGGLSAWPPNGLHAAGSATMVLQINNRDGGAPYIEMAVQNAQRALNYQLGLLKNGPAPSYVPSGFIQTYANQYGRLACVDSAGADCLRSVLNVKDFGAIGDGLADDTPAFSAAINKAATEHGAVIIVPNGTYLISQLTLPANTPVTIQGMGWSYDAGCVTKIKSVAAAALFSPVDGANGNTIRDVCLDGNATGTYGWYGRYGNKTRAINVLVENFTQAGLYFEQGLNVLERSYIRLNATGVVWASDGWVTNNEIASNTSVGLHVKAGGNRITDNLINSNGSYGLYIDGTAGTNSINSLSNLYMGENTTHNIYIEGQSSGNRTVQTAQLSNVYIQQVTNRAADGIYVKYSRQISINGVNFLGGEDTYGADTGGVIFDTSDTSQVLNVLSYKSTRNAVKIASSGDILVNGILATLTANSSTSTDDSYGVLVDSGSARAIVGNVNVTDTRSPGYSRGLKIANTTSTVWAYNVTTPVASPTSISSNQNVMTGGSGQSAPLSILRTDTSNEIYFLNKVQYFYNAASGSTGFNVTDDNNTMPILYFSKPGASTVAATQYGKWTSNGIAFAALGTATGGQYVWCSDCNVASPCTSGGSGAWAFANGAAWNCPF